MPVNSTEFPDRVAILNGFDGKFLVGCPKSYMIRARRIFIFYKITRKGEFIYFVPSVSIPDDPKLRVPGRVMSGGVLADRCDRIITRSLFKFDPSGVLLKMPCSHPLTVGRYFNVGSKIYGDACYQFRIPPENCKVRVSVPVLHFLNLWHSIRSERFSKNCRSELSEDLYSIDSVSDSELWHSLKYNLTIYKD